MWITLFFVCLSVILPIEAQELPTLASQTDTETPYTNYAVNWDSTRPPVTLTIRDGRSDKKNRTVEEKTEQPLYYSNEWQSLLLPIGYGNNADQISYQNENESSMDHQFVPTFLRRPDSEPNNNINPQPGTQNVERNELASAQIPFAPVFYYAHHPTFYEINGDRQFDNKQNLSVLEPRAVLSESIRTISDKKESEISRGISQTSQDQLNSFEFYRNNQRYMPYLNIFNPAVPSQSAFDYTQATETNNKQTLSPHPKSVVSEPITSSTNENKEETSETKRAPQIPAAFPPLNYYRNFPGFIPPMAPMFYPPYPFLPFNREGIVQPTIPYPNNVPNFDREVGPGIITDEIGNPEKQVVSADVSESVPVETPGSVIPPPPLPLPVAGFPYGLLPPPFLPPLIPNAPIPAGVPLNRLPFPDPANGQKESIVANPIAPPPITQLTPSLENIPVVLPKVEYAETNEGFVPESPIAPEEVLPVEQPTVAKLPYEFGFDMNDGKGNDQHRKEVSDGSGVVTGSYGYRDVFGVYRMVNYIADKDGFRAFVKSNEPGVASSGSAHVVVLAERPPPHAVAESLKASEQEVVVVPGDSSDLLTAGSSTETK